MNMHVTVLRRALVALLIVTPAGAQPAVQPGTQEEELIVVNGAVSLAGTLMLPAGKGPFPAVVLLSGSGPQDRDAEIFGFKVFQQLAAHLARSGVAVYRYDDRGVGGSTGQPALSTSQDVAGDALAILASLGARPDIDRRRIGLLGVSEGGSAASIAAARSSDVAFVVLLAAPALRGDIVLRQQTRDLSRAQGLSEDAIARIIAAHERATEAVLSGEPREKVEVLVEALVRAQLEAAPTAQRAALGDLDAYARRSAGPVAAQLSSPAAKFLLQNDPAVALRALKCPVLAVFGSLDTQVPPSLHEAPMKAALASNSAATVRTLQGANHLFQKAETGQPSEYATLEKAFAPSLIDLVTSWLRERM